MARRWFVLAGGALLAGCSLLTSLDGLSSDGGADVIDASSIEASAGNLVLNPSFDDSTGGCGPHWGNGYGMTFTRVSPGRTGPYACQVCVQGTTQTSYALAYLPTIPVNAGTYYAEAWVSTPEGGVAVQSPGAGILVGYDIDAGISGCSGVGSICQGSIVAPPMGSFVQTTASFTANGPGTVTITIHAFEGTPSSCFIVDDVAFVAQ